MKNTFKSLAFTALIATASLGTIALLNPAYSAELFDYKSTSTKVMKMTDESVEKLLSSNNPACIKDGSRILKVNAAFIGKSLGYRDCSQSDAAIEKQKMRGYTVNVLKLESITSAKAKSLGLI